MYKTFLNGYSSTPQTNPFFKGCKSGFLKNLAPFFKKQYKPGPENFS